MVKKKTKTKHKKVKKPAKSKHTIKHNIKHKVKHKVTSAKPLNKLEVLKAGCRLWDRITTKAFHSEYPMPKEIDRHHGPLYAAGDYSVLQCKIAGSLAELTVGSTAGHKAKLNLDDHTLEYFDNRKYNNWTMWEILKPLKCNRDESGVHCTGIKTKAQILHVFRAMAMPTSMDFRQSYCESDHETDKCRKAEVKFFKSGPKHTVLVAQHE